jgi:hypothetical protein
MDMTGLIKRRGGLGPLVRWVAGGASSAVVLAVVLACVSSVDGERSATGTCPEGEVCSEATPEGLTFVGTAFYDDQEGIVRLGPILEGGRFSLGLRTTAGEDLPPFELEVSDVGVLASEPGTGEFLDGVDGSASLVQAHVTLHGLSPGQTHVRVVDPATGELYDRLLLDVYELEDIEVVNLSDARREHLYAECEEMIGVRLVAKDGPTRFRAIDQDLTLLVDGEPMERERGLWDCFLFTPEKDRTEVHIQVGAASQVVTHTLPVLALEEDGLEQCPPRRAVD